MGKASGPISENVAKQLAILIYVLLQCVQIQGDHPSVLNTYSSSLALEHCALVVGMLQAQNTVQMASAGTQTAPCEL